MSTAETPGGAGESIVDAARDLLLGSHCLGCSRPGRLVCPACAAALVAQPAPCWPSPTPPGMVEPWAATAYAGLARSMVLGHKEDGLLSLRRPLAALLASAVVGCLDPRAPPHGVLVLVPVPSRPATVRSRGHDAVGTVTRSAGALLAGPGIPVLVAPVLRQRAGVADQAGLDAAGRRANLAGSMSVPTRGLRRLAGRLAGAPPRVVVCDDVVTTGSTLREAQRALEAVGLLVEASASVASTRLRAPAVGSGDSSAKLQVNAFRPPGVTTNVGPWSPSGSVVTSSRRPGPPALRVGSSGTPPAAHRARWLLPAVLGSSTRWARWSEVTTNCSTGGSHGSCGHRSTLRAVGRLPQPRRGEAGPAREARPPHHAGLGGGGV